MSVCVISLCGVDPHLGKVEKASLPQQALMEMLIEGIKNKKSIEKIYGKHKEPADISEWKGLTFNENEEVTDIEWPYSVLRGPLSLQWLPFSVKKLFVFSNKLTGPIDFTSLPYQMEELDLSSNNFTGEVDLSSLPETMKRLNISENQLSGTLDLAHLPATMHILQLKENSFSGETDFSKFPKSLRMLDVSSTDLSGDIHFVEGTWLDAANSKVKVHRNLWAN